MSISFDPSLEYFKRIGTPVVALATAAGGPVSIIRVSGKNLEKFFLPLFNRAHLEERKAEYLSVVGLDKALVLFFKGPRSFTGEDVLEVQGHGVPALQEAIIEKFVELGARRALPGEFSFRAVFLEKMTLQEAELLNEALSTESITAGGARELLNIDPSNKEKTQKLFFELKEALVSARGRLESAIDFSEAEEEQSADVESGLEYLNELQKSLDVLLSGLEQSAQKLTEPRVVIVGEANAGKSTLLNFLSSSDRAIVSSVPGTTRDYIEVRAKLAGKWVRMMDTAGFRELNSSELSEHEELESLGLKKGEEILRTASVIIWVKNATKDELSGKLPQLLSVINKPTVLIHSFADRCNNENILAGSFDLRSENPEIRAYIESEIERLGVFRGGQKTDEKLLFSNRQLELLQKLQSEVLSAKNSLVQSMALEIAAEQLKDGEMYLNRCIGQELDDAYIGAIFSQFCLGK